MRISTVIRNALAGFMVGTASAGAADIAQAEVRGDRVVLTFTAATNRYIIERFDPASASVLAVGTSSGIVDQGSTVGLAPTNTGFFRIRAGLQAVRPADVVLQAELRQQVGAGKLEPTNWLYDVELAGLTNLNVAVRGISTLDGLAGLPDLAWFDAGGNRIEDIQGLTGLEGLRLLRLDGNRLDSLAGLEDFTSLQVLDVSHNMLRQLAPIGNLVTLQVLYADHNQLQHVTGLENLLNLQLLDLSGNQLTSLAPLLANAQQGGLGSGDTVYLSGNTGLDEGEVAALRGYGVTVFYP